MAGVSIGGPIFLLVVGAILKFAVTATFAGIDVQVVGVILMVAGAAWLAISLVMLASRGGGGPAGPPPPPR